MFDHILNRSLAHVTRFNSLPQNFPESVAEHSFFVAYFVVLLGQVLKDKGVACNLERTMSMALIHDIEEKFSGDILSPFKHYSPEITEAIRSVNKEVIPYSFEGLPEKISEHCEQLWKEENAGDSIEAQIVKVADKLSLIAKCSEEVKVGNTFFEAIYAQEVEALQVYPPQWWQDIKERVLA